MAPKKRGNKSAKAIPPALKQALANARKRKESIVVFIRDDLLLSEDTGLVTPSLGDIAHGDAFPDLRALLEARLEDDATERARLEQVARASFPTALQAWRGTIALQLFDRFAKGGPGMANLPPKDASVKQKLHWLSLATTLFMCTRALDGSCADCADDVDDDDNAPDYDKMMRYPYVLSHKCLRGSDSATDDTPRAWSPATLAPDSSRTRLVADLVRASGLDPASATYQDMDACDARLTCKLCLEKNLLDADCASTWWDCMGHFDAAHSGVDVNPVMPLPCELRYPVGGRVDWVRLNPTAEAKARELAPRRTKDFGLAWRCVSCPAPFKVFQHRSIAEGHGLMWHGLGREAVQRGEGFVTVDNYLNVDGPELVYIWQLRQAGLSQYFPTPELDAFYFKKLIKMFGKIPTTFPSRPAEKCAWSKFNQPGKRG
ncbi:hypothetical protein EXIGLDRAFT_706788 [Exidia glandulosa HHB12029]|uniref:Uncharacterized protein n=1 Tax=Exidia glandulosa HHB12029 TaxID=1314781 RepID=A0A165K3J0_EXIGL|nr:hypothetical protein EXIGLDRAFT_706788 [Exidia glandulosa HHB12029]